MYGNNTYTCTVPVIIHTVPVSIYMYSNNYYTCTVPVIIHALPVSICCTVTVSIHVQLQLECT